MQRPLAMTGLLALGTLLVHFVMPCATASPPTAARPAVLIGVAHEEGIWVAGAYDARHGWQAAQKAQSQFKSGTRFSLFDERGAAGSATLSNAPPETELNGYYVRTREKRPTPRAGATTMLALSGAKRPIVRRPRVQALNNPTYQKAVASLLRDAKLQVTRAQLTQHWRVDLNGDGVEEVLLSAHSRPGMGREARAFKGDYALTALRFVHRGTAKIVPLAGDIYLENHLGGAVAASRLELLGTLDINNDGRMEIVISTSYYEGEGIEIWSFDGQRVRRVLEAGWGA